MVPFRLYLVEARDYFFSAEGALTFRERRDKVCDPMNQLIHRYRLRGKSVLSIGCGLAYEEYWFSKNGCSLTLIYIDEKEIIEPRLKELPPGGSGQESLLYFIGDAGEVCPTLGKFDVCYFSGFTPDELRRQDIVSQHVERASDDRHPSWPKDAQPFCSLVMDVLRANLAVGGLFIHQSYCGGPDLQANPHFLVLAQEQLRTVGVELIEAYYLADSPGVKLMVGYRGSEVEAVAFARKISSRPELTTFHGRADVASHSVVKAFMLR